MKRCESHIQTDLKNGIDEELTIHEISEKIKNILFCSISHELRSPLNHINGILGKFLDFLNKKFGAFN